jgi:8-oxo-dGTP pyrophosphatase MutT (NUDIX family)
MAHVNPEGTDLVVSAFVVHQHRVLLVHHRKLGLWLAPGGHVEKHEDPDQALFRELKEETGLGREDLSPLTVVHVHPRALKFQQAMQEDCGPGNHNRRQLLTPWLVEVHDFPPLPGHRHAAMVYLLRARRDDVVLEADHHAIGWFDGPALDRLEPSLESIRRMGKAALLLSFSPLEVTSEVG